MKRPIYAVAAWTLPALAIPLLLTAMAGPGQARVYDETEWYGTAPYYNDYDDFYFDKFEGVGAYTDTAYDPYTGHYYPKFYGTYIRNHYPSYYSHGDYTSFGPALAPNEYGGARFYGPYPRYDGARTLYEEPYGYDNYYYENHNGYNTVNRRNANPVPYPKEPPSHYTKDWYQTTGGVEKWH